MVWSDNSVVAHARSERFVEGDLVQEHVGILELPVEPILHLFHTLHHTFQVAIPREHDDGSVRAPILYDRGIIMPNVFARRDTFRGGLLGAHKSVGAAQKGQDEVQADL